MSYHSCHHALGAAEAYATDYMAVPSARRMRFQADAVVSWLEKAQARQRPLEDWVESKLTRAANDLDDVHNFVVYSDVARIR